MTTTISLEISLESLIQAVASLDLGAKRHLIEVIEQQIFEAQEEDYVEDSETKAEIESVKLEYQQGDAMTIDDFIQSQVN
ncbi:hypothetical protein [Phormidium sp. FACHB-1136]|uniref:hypothetical protein n=1 Tax=Phormidium sp. FACHB-1136 TaxID=2692848 RepID=UPI00168483BF|nr:hypothetical protein [Phormidium sp. FACHB-1136]MBD2425047.1 hypothetical protein [Phormidium sp. FACHB-1136]